MEGEVEYKLILVIAMLAMFVAGGWLGMMHGELMCLDVPASESDAGTAFVWIGVFLIVMIVYYIGRMAQEYYADSEEADPEEVE